MPKKHFLLNLIFVIGAGFAMLGFECFCFAENFFQLKENSKNVVFAQTCKPVDVILVIDKSGSMSDFIPEEAPPIVKMQAAKTASNNFINLLIGDDHIGIISFSDDAFLDQTLTDDKTAAKGAVSSLSPGGGTSTHKGIGAAWLEFGSPRARSDSPHAMIILTDGRPNSPDLAVSQANIAKNQGIRIIVIGYDIDSNSNPEATRITLNTIASTVSDYHEAPTTEDLINIYNLLAFQLCDSNPPEIASFSRSPSGTVFSGDEINITSTATDNTDEYDWGLLNHRIEWTDNNWGTTNSCESPTLNLGDKVDTFICNIGPFSEGTEIKSRAYAKDLAAHEVYSAEESFEVAAASILNAHLIVDQPNIIEVEIDDPEGKAHFDKYYVEIESPTGGAIKVDKTEMTCSYSGSIYECSYTLCPSCAYEVDNTWGATANIIIYPWDSDSGFRNPATEKEVDVISDTDPPTVVIVACNINKNETGDACDAYGGDIISDGGFVLDTDNITLVSIAGDASGIQNQKIFYWVNGTPFVEEWIIGGNMSTTKTTTIGPYSAGTLIQYQSEATDVWNNTALTLKYSFSVYSTECYNLDGTPKPDLTSCAGGAGKCCAGICDVSFSCSLDDECRGEICSSASWTCGAQNEGVDCCDGADCDGCFAYTAGCEERDYSCSSGSCSYNFSNRNDDVCSGQNYLNYQCIGISCNLLETIDCSLAGNWDGDAVLCNCDCDDYDVEETISNGNCEDGKDNDCDGLTDCEEPACDDEDPVIAITADDSSGIPIPNGGDVLDMDTNRVSLTIVSVEMSPCAISPNTLYEVKVFYNENNGPWNLIFTCTDADGNGQCDEDASKNIENFDVEIPINGFSVGTRVGYRSEAVDTAPVPNAGFDEGFFNVISVECQAMPDLTPCTGGKCCAQVCDTNFDCSLDGGCSGETCSGTSWECGAGNEGASCTADWTKFRAIEIDNSNNPSNLTDYQVKLNIDYDLDMQPDFGDLRFVDKNGASLRYWIEEKTDSVSAVVWVKVLSIPANSAEYIYMHYGNAAVESASDAENTFLRVIDESQPLKGSWNFDGDLTDSSGNNNDGSAGIARVNGKINKALDFDGADDYVIIKDDESLDVGTTGFTVEGWFKIPVYSIGTNREMIDKRNGKGYWSAGEKGWSIWHKVTQDYFMFILDDGANIEYKYWSFSNSLNGYVNQWALITWTIDENGYIKTYFNGDLKNTQQFTVVDLNNVAGSDDLWIGQGFSDPGLPYDGTIDEVRIYNRALTEIEVAEHYNGTFSDETGLKGLWHFDETSGNFAIDSSGNGNTGTLEPNYPSLADGKFGKALDFDGDNDYVTILDDPTLDISGGKVTLEAWLYPHSYSTTSPIKTSIFEKGGNYGMVIRESGSLIYHQWGWTSSSSHLPLNKWIHTVITYDKDEASDRIKFYFDGALDNTSNWYQEMHTNSSDLIIGDGSWYGGGQIPFDGTIDEVRIYDRALSSDEISDLYNNYGYTTPNAPGKVLIRKYSLPEPISSVRFESDCPSLDFDGVDDYVDIGEDLISEYSGAIEVWINTNSLTGDHFIAHIGNGAGSGPGPEVGFMQVNNQMRFRSSSDGLQLQSIIPDTDINEWHHWVAVWGGTMAKMYRDGIEVAEDTWNGGPINKLNNSSGTRDYCTYNPSDPGCPLNPVGNWFTKYPLRMGEFACSTWGRYWDGMIDEFRIYNRALSAKEIKEHYDGIFTDETGLAGLWHFDNTIGGVVSDSSGNGNDGVLKPGYPGNAPALIDECPPFNPEENIDYTSGCFPFDTGCEQRGSPICGSGYCNISRDRHTDHCQDINYVDYECGAFTKRAPITIDNSANPSALTDYQVKLDIIYDPDMQPDFDDLRFVDKNGNPLSYWIESKIDGVSAVVWVKVPSVSASATESIYMHYGNAGVSSMSDISMVFGFFDDFTGKDGDDINRFKWDTEYVGSGTVKIQNNRLQFDITGVNDRQERSIAKFNIPFLYGIEFYNHPANNDKIPGAIYVWIDWDNLIYLYYAPPGNNITYRHEVGGVSSGWFNFPIALSTDNMHSLGIEVMDSGYKIFVDGDFKDMQNIDLSSWNNMHVMITGWNDYPTLYNSIYDNAFVFEKILPEPISSFGGEENVAESLCSVVSSDPDPSCDVEPPTVSIEAKDNTDAVILDGDEIHPSLTDKVALSSIAFDNHILQSHQVQYRVNSGAWITLFDCGDTDLNGFCDDDDQNSVPFEAGENSAIGIAFLSGSVLPELKIGPFVHNDLVEYRGIATDIAQPDFHTTTVQQSFTAKIPNVPPTVAPIGFVNYPNATNYWEGGGADCWKALQTKVMWSYSDFEGSSQDAYQVEVYNDAGYTSLVFDSCNPPSLTCAPGHFSKDKIIPTSVLDWNTNYWWRVKVYDGEDWSGFANGASFKTPLHSFPSVDFTFAPDPSLLDAPVDIDFTQTSKCYYYNEVTSTVKEEECGKSEKTSIIHIGWDFYRETNIEPNPPNGGGETLDININDGDGINPNDTYGHTFFINMPYPVYFQITDQDGYTCSIIKNIIPGGMKYPWWKEILPK